jgi:hypothetical protein
MLQQMNLSTKHIQSDIGAKVIVPNIMPVGMKAACTPSRYAYDKKGCWHNPHPSTDAGTKKTTTRQT